MSISQLLSWLISTLFSTGESEHSALVVLNALLGGFAHSKLFVNVREKGRAGLYNFSSNFDIFQE